MPPVSRGSHQLNKCEVFYYHTLDLSHIYIQRVPPLFGPHIQNLNYRLGHKIDFPVGDEEKKCLCFHSIHEQFDFGNFSFWRKFAINLGVHCIRKDGEYLYYGELFRLEAVFEDKKGSFTLTPTKLAQRPKNGKAYFFHFIYYDHDHFRK